jgi:hypothetical protein
MRGHRARASRLRVDRELDGESAMNPLSRLMAVVD